MRIRVVNSAVNHNRTNIIDVVSLFNNNTHHLHRTIAVIGPSLLPVKMLTWISIELLLDIILGSISLSNHSISIRVKSRPMITALHGQRRRLQPIC